MSHNNDHPPFEPTVLPFHPLFNRLLRFAHEQPPRLCIRDLNTDTSATHSQLLTDVLAFRRRIWDSLGEEARRLLRQRDEVYIAVLAAGGYEFAVAILAALALGAAVVPMTVLLPPKEALYFARKSRAVAVLVSDAALRLGLEVEKLVKNEDPRRAFVCVPVRPAIATEPLSPGGITTSRTMFLDDRAPGVVIFTSGTTGPPKGAVMPLSFVHDEAMAVVDHYRVTRNDVLLHLLPVHHATGIGMMFFPFLIGGALQEFKSGNFDPAWTWERWKRGAPHPQELFFSGVPTIYMRMMRHYQQSIAPRADAADYLRGARAIRVCICGTSALPAPIADFWSDLLGQKILSRFGMTEVGAVIKMRLGDEDVPDGSIGTVAPGCDVILSEGEEGEILARSPGMMSKFLYDPEATAAAHTADGRYRTGDIARREGGYYFILGRASVDIIKSGGYKISSLDIEREILGLEYVGEVMVVGVPDEEYGERVAALIRLRGEPGVVTSDGENPLLPDRLDLSRLRGDLKTRLAGYKMPTVLRVITDEIPKSGTGKVEKKTLGPRFFPPGVYHGMPEIEVWRRNLMSKI